MKSFALFIVLFLVSFAQAQTSFFGKPVEIVIPHGTYTTTTNGATHGGFSWESNFGMNEGDDITIDVTCDHDIAGWCFEKGPALDFCPNGVNSRCKGLWEFQLTYWEFRHQTYDAKAVKQGDNFVAAAYGWIGPDVNYWLEIVATEIQ